MKKSDYLHLTQAIRMRTDAARKARDTTENPETLRNALATLRTMEEFAHGLARVLHVDRVAFLIACGV